MKNSPIVSVLLPTHNGSRFITKSIRSVLSQKFDALELVVIDDGSTDSTAQIVKEFADRDNRVVLVLNKKNMGIQKSLNRGLGVAKGKYIARIDDDDTWAYKDKLDEQVRLLNAHPDYVLVGTGTIVVDDEGHELFRFLNKETDEVIRSSMLGRNCFTHSSVIFRKDAAMRFGGYSEEEDVLHVEDYDLWLKLGTVGKMVNLQTYGVVFTLRPDNISSRNKIEQFRKDILLAREHKEYYPHYWWSLLRNYARVAVYGIFDILPLAALKTRILEAYKKHY